MLECRHECDLYYPFTLPLEAKKQKKKKKKKEEDESWLSQSWGSQEQSLLLHFSARGRVPGKGGWWPLGTGRFFQRGWGF